MTTTMKQLPPSRREALRAYLMEVVRDLLARGVIRQQSGQTLIQVFRAESQTILSEVSADFAAVGKEIGFSLLNGIGGLVGTFFSRRR